MYLLLVLLPVYHLYGVLTSSGGGPFVRGPPGGVNPQVEELRGTWPATPEFL